MSRNPFVRLVLTALVWASPAVAFAQDNPSAKVVGRSGAVQLEVSGSLDHTRTAQDSSQPANYNIRFGVGRFLTDGLIVRGSISGSGQIGSTQSGLSAAEEATFRSLGIPVPEGGGGSRPNLYGAGGATLYMTPDKPASFYVGGDLQSNLTGQTKMAQVVGVTGFQTALSPTASFYAEGFVGTALTTPSNPFGGESPRQITNGARFGFRFLF